MVLCSLIRIFATKPINKDKMKRLFYLLSTALMLAVTFVSCSKEDNGGSPVVPPEEKVDSARLTIIFYGTVGGNADSQAETAWEIMKPYLHQKDVRVMVYRYDESGKDR